MPLCWRYSGVITQKKSTPGSCRFLGGTRGSFASFTENSTHVEALSDRNDLTMLLPPIFTDHPVEALPTHLVR